MTDSNELYTGMENDDGLSNVMSTETLADRDLIKMTSLEVHNLIN